MPEESPYGGRQSAATVIANGVRVEGDFSSQGDVLIEGEVHGNVATTAMLTVGPQARLKADVKAEKAVIAGTVEGNLTIASHLDLKSTACIVGDVTCETAAVESGAAMNGRATIGAKAHQTIVAKIEAPIKHEPKNVRAHEPKEDE